jgi:thiopurine S-methyltransferase
LPYDPPFEADAVDSSFWIDVWREGRRGFHRDHVNPALEQFWPARAAASSVLVPLCGKSLDMLWLERQGLHVTGVEIAEQAVLEFCHDNGLAYSVNHREHYVSYRLHARNIRLVVGDFFTFAEHCAAEPFDCLYDRAALAALPPAMRKPYVRACRALLSEAATGMVQTLEYEQELMQGPPFSVPVEEVQRLWQNRLSCVDERDVLDEVGKARAAGLPRVQEFTWLLLPAETRR